MLEPLDGPVVLLRDFLVTEPSAKLNETAATVTRILANAYTQIKAAKRR